jgi:hypothetical protein
LVIANQRAIDTGYGDRADRLPAKSRIWFG